MVLVDKVPTIHVTDAGPAGHVTVETIRNVSYGIEFIANGGEESMTFHLSGMQSGDTYIMAVSAMVNGGLEMVIPVQMIRTQHLETFIADALFRWIPRKDWGQITNLIGLLQNTAHML